MLYRKVVILVIKINVMAKKSKLLDEVRQIIRVKHYRYSTEKCYVNWIYRYIFFCDNQHPKEMGEK
jgi:hypothetical protein